MELDVLTKLIRQLDEESRATIDALATGGASDYPAYREMCGRLQGFSVGMRMLGEMRSRLSRGDEE